MYEDLEEAQRINQMLKITRNEGRKNKGAIRQLCGPNLAHRPIDFMVIAPKQSCIHRAPLFNDKPAVLKLLQMGG